MKKTSNLSRYREEIGLSQTELARKMNVTQQCISSWQTGRTDIRISFFSSLRLLKIQAGERYVIFIKDGCGMILSF